MDFEAAKGPQTAVVIPTGHEEDEHVFEGIRAGAQDYLLKDSEPDDLSRAIHTVYAGAGLQEAKRRFGARETIYVPGNPGGHLHFLLEGTVRLYKIYGDYKEATTALLTEGDVFGELSLDERPARGLSTTRLVVS